MAIKHKPAATIADDPLNAFRLRIKKQYGVEPLFVAHHSHDKTDGGIYEFNVTLQVGKAVGRCYIWKFISTVADGQVAMDVPDAEAKAGEIVEQWLLARKTAIKLRR